MPRAAVLLATIAATAVGVCTGAPAAPARAPAKPHAPAARRPPAPTRTTLTADTTRPGPAVARDFLGLSFENKSITQIGSYANSGDLANLLRSLGGGLLRFGGVTSDTQVAWVGSGQLPSWAVVGLHPGDFDGLGALARETGWRVLLTLNFLHPDPAGAAAEAAEAHRALGDSLAGLAFGNEPDAYPEELLRPEPWNFLVYQQQLALLRQLLAPSELSLPFAGPDAASGVARLSWVTAEAQFVSPELLTAHFYPMSWCVGLIPSIDDLLSPGVRATETRRLTQMANIGRLARIPVRVTETNSVSCGGEPGVSNTFASALWATDFIVRAMSAGVAGINFHGNVANFFGYSPLAASGPQALAAGDLTPQPEWYALLLARQLIGAQPLPTTLRNGGPDVSAQAFAAPGRQMKVALVDERDPGSGTRQIQLQVPRRLGAASVLRLTGPSRTATSGVALGGSQVAPDGTWAAPRHGVLLPVRHGQVAVAMPAASAALVTLYPRT